MGKRFQPVFGYPGKKYSADELDTLRHQTFLIAFVLVVAAIIVLPRTEAFLCFGIALLFIGNGVYQMGRMNKIIQEEREWQEYLDRTLESSPPNER
jgi:hypothetical protein